MACKKCGSTRRWKNDRHCVDCLKMKAVTRQPCAVCGTTERYSSGRCKKCTKTNLKRFRATPQHREYSKEQEHIRYWSDPEATKRRISGYLKNLREEMLMELGRECACCGDDTEPLLTLDHIAMDGRRERPTKKALARARREGWPKTRYRVLCMSCNWGAARYGGRCPHENRAQDLAKFLLSA